MKSPTDVLFLRVFFLCSQPDGDVCFVIFFFAHCLIAFLCFFFGVFVFLIFFLHFPLFFRLFFSSIVILSPFFLLLLFFFSFLFLFHSFPVVNLLMISFGVEPDRIILCLFNNSCSPEAITRPFLPHPYLPQQSDYPLWLYSYKASTLTVVSKNY